MENDHVVADMVEATEFPQLSNKYAVMSVPKTIVNGRSTAEGAMPEPAFLDDVLAATQEMLGS